VVRFTKTGRFSKRDSVSRVRRFYKPKTFLAVVLQDYIDRLNCVSFSTSPQIDRIGGVTAYTSHEIRTQPEYKSKICWGDRGVS
jgi:hypothetical protein